MTPGTMTAGIIVLLFHHALPQTITRPEATPLQKQLGDILVGMGVESSGGGSVVSLRPGSEPRFLDYINQQDWVDWPEMNWNLPKVRGPGVRLYKRAEAQEISYDDPELLPVRRYLENHFQAHLPYRPFITARLSMALYDLRMKATQKPIPLDAVTYELDWVVKSLFKKLQVQHVVHFHPLEGTWLNVPLWNKLSLEEQAGLLVHEAFRVIQYVDRSLKVGSSISERKISTMTFSYMTEDPSSVSYSLRRLEKPTSYRGALRNSLKVYDRSGRPELIKEGLGKVCRLSEGVVDREFQAFRKQLCAGKSWHRVYPAIYLEAPTHADDMWDWAWTLKRAGFPLAVQVGELLYDLTLEARSILGPKLGPDSASEYGSRRFTIFFYEYLGNRIIRDKEHLRKLSIYLVALLDELEEYHVNRVFLNKVSRSKVRALESKTFDKVIEIAGELEDVSSISSRHHDLLIEGFRLVQAFGRDAAKINR